MKLNNFLEIYWSRTQTWRVEKDIGKYLTLKELPSLNKIGLIFQRWFEVSYLTLQKKTENLGNINKQSLIILYIDRLRRNILRLHCLKSPWSQGGLHLRKLQVTLCKLNFVLVVFPFKDFCDELSKHD